MGEALIVICLIKISLKKKNRLSVISPQNVLNMAEDGGSGDFQNQRFSTPKNARGRGSNFHNSTFDNSFSSFQMTPRGQRHGSPQFTPRGHRHGSPQTPHSSGGFRGRGGFRDRGNFRGRGGNHSFHGQSSILDYYSPAMPQDPWVSIESYRSRENLNQSDTA